MASTDILWRVQIRQSRESKWENISGLFETRSSARKNQYLQRSQRNGWGNTRVIKYVKGASL